MGIGLGYLGALRDPRLPTCRREGSRLSACWPIPTVSCADWTERPRDVTKHTAGCDPVTVGGIPTDDWRVRL